MPKAKTPRKKATATKKRHAAAKKALTKRKAQAVVKKAVTTSKRHAEAAKAVTTRKRHAAAKKAAATRVRKNQVAAAPPAVARTAGDTPIPHLLKQVEKEAALQALLQTRSAISELSAPSESGAYAIYLRTKGLLEPFKEVGRGLIYIGLSTNLADREFEQHFSSANTGRSTLRRSLGAILKRQLALVAIPRAPGPSESNVRNYCFLEDGETRLTNWMCEHLEIGVYASPKYLELENFLVPELKPPLNLNKWRNPHRTEIMELRKVSADEARRARAHRGNVP
jgi:hypothetical protein